MVSCADSNASSQAGAKASLHGLVAALPEIYQPIFGHPELSLRVTRECGDRLTHIAQVYGALEAKLGRPLRVLDLGCAQGFFSFSLARLGATVCGVDLQEGNVAVCNALAEEHPELKVSFSKGLLEQVIINTVKDQYDLVLGLSVFHHIVHIIGPSVVQSLISVLANATVMGIFELALANEPTKRAHSQPPNPRELLNGYAFVHELAQHATHLRNSERPLYIASNRYWFLDGQIGRFDTWQADSHELAKGSYRGTRRYFIGDGLLAKLFTLENEKFRDINLEEHKNESDFLGNPVADIKAPALVLCGQNRNEVWLVREHLPGELLLDRLRQGKVYDAQRVLEDVLEQLAALETAGIYHNDLRTWNILIGDDGHAAVIDYGALSHEKKDRGWPYNIFLSFMIFVQEVLNGKLAIPDPIRPTLFNPESFPEPYRRILWKLYERAPDEWSFAFLRDNLQSRDGGVDVSATARQSFAVVMQAMEDACKIHQSAAHYWRRQAEPETHIPNE